MSDLIELEECPVQDLPSENVDGRSVDCPVAKRRRKDYTVADKLVVLAALNSGESAHAVSQRTGIDRKSLRLWKTQELALNEQSKKRIVRRLPGGGRSPFYPEIDAELFEFFSSEREQRRSVTYKTLQSRIQSSDFKSTIPAEFKVSDKYIYGWARRHNITSRRITHHGQVDNRPVAETLAAVESYFLSLRYASATLPTSRIFNMDETPCYVDMSRDSTLHFKGSKNVDGADTGYRKHRYTVVLCSCLDGRMLMPMIIFKGLQKAPKVSVLTKTAHVTASMSGSLDTRLAIEWLKNVFSSRGPYFSTTRSLLIWDSYGSHKREEVTSIVRKHFNSEFILLPPKTTYYLQPLDVGVNSAFKANMKSEWEYWLRTAPAEFTPKGYRKRPSYQIIVEMVISSVSKISAETVKRSFECCGISEKGQSVPDRLLNSRLQELFGVSNGSMIGNEDDESDHGLAAGSCDEALDYCPADELSEASDDNDSASD